jgi:glutaredoxin 3
MTARVRMYSTSYCGYCLLAKRLLRARGIPFTDIDVTRDRAERDRVIAETGHPTVPVIFIDDRFIGGSDELHELDSAGELEPLRAGTPAA